MISRCRMLWFILSECQAECIICEAHGQSSLPCDGGNGQGLLLGLGAAVHFCSSILSNYGACHGCDHWKHHALLLPPVLVTCWHLRSWQTMFAFMIKNKTTCFALLASVGWDLGDPRVQSQVLRGVSCQILRKVELRHHSHIVVIA